MRKREKLLKSCNSSNLARGRIFDKVSTLVHGRFRFMRRNFTALGKIIQKLFNCWSILSEKLLFVPPGVNWTPLRVRIFYCAEEFLINLTKAQRRGVKV